MKTMGLSFSSPPSFASIRLSPCRVSLNRTCERRFAVGESSDRRGCSEVKRLLCVDDSPEMLGVLVDMLRAEFMVVGALTSSSAMAEAANLRPDIILLDVDLGDASGFVVAEQLRRAGCPAKIVFLSVHENVEFVDAAREIGASGYIFKSQITRDLKKMLHSVV
jgi:DNA-binding NarL/FixJ family response regulator